MDGGRMIRNIIFDIGQVLVSFRWKEFMDDLGFTEEQKDRIGKATVEGPLWKEFDRGILSFSEIVEGCIQLEPELEEEIRLFYKDMSTIVKEFDYSETLLRGLKEQGYQIYLLSNYGERNFSYIENKLRFFPYVDGQIISYRIQHIKPEPEIYQALLETYQLKPEESVFLDDVEENLKEAETFGIHTIHFTSLSAGIQGLQKKGITVPATILQRKETMELKNIDGVMFDLDGTLWDSTEAAAKIWSEVVKKRGLSSHVTASRLKELYGLPLEEIAVQLFPQLSKEEAIDIMEECVVVQCPVLRKEGGILLGKVKETLQELQKQVPLFLVSNCRSGYIEAFLEAHQMEGLFTDYACPGDTGKLKADNIRIVMERNQVKHPIYLGDTQGDQIAAAEANVLFIFARYGFGSASGYEYAIDSVEELLPLLNGKTRA